MFGEDFVSFNPMTGPLELGTGEVRLWLYRAWAVTLCFETMHKESAWRCMIFIKAVQNLLALGHGRS